MERTKSSGSLTMILAVAGTVLVWLPLAAPVVLGAGNLVVNGRFLLDYLMPAELFPLALVGCVLLVWAGLRSGGREPLKIIGWGLGAAIISLAGCQGLAELTGLADGRTEPEGLPFILVTLLLGVFIMLLVVVGVGAVRLLQHILLSRRKNLEGG